MDWLTVVMIIIFFVLPVIQQVLEQSRKSRGVRRRRGTKRRQVLKMDCREIVRP